MSTLVVGPSKQDEKEAHAVKMGLINDLEKMRDGICQEITDELDNLMLEAQRIAYDMCPKDTFALANSITIGSGVISSGSDFYNATLGAGDETINWKTGKMTAEYALYVHDGHVMPNGEFWEGVPFLMDGMNYIESQLEACVNRALAELGVGE